MDRYRTFNVGENRYMAPKLVAVILLVGIQYDGEHCEGGEEYTFPEGFASELVHSNRARYAGKGPAGTGVVTSPDPKPTNQDPHTRGTKGKK